MIRRQFSDIVANELATDVAFRAAKRSDSDRFDRVRGQTEVDGQGSNIASQFVTPLRHRDSVCMRILALGGALGPLLFAAVVGVCGALRPGYSHINQFISELGATGTIHATLMNFAGFVAAFLLIAGFGIATVWLIPHSARSILAGGLITFFGLGIALAGIFHCDPGCPQHGASLAATIHDRISIAAFLACIAGIGLFASHFRRTPAFRPLWKYSAASSVASLVFLGLLASSLDPRHLTGLWQRLLIGTLFVWCVVLGRRLFHENHRNRRSGNS